MDEPVRCAICQTLVQRHCSYVARIELFADPANEAIDTTDPPAADSEEVFAAILKELQNMSADDAMDDVHRRFEFHLCRDCQRAMLANPLGLPRPGVRTWDGPN